jgi:hypothetical protein
MVCGYDDVGHVHILVSLICHALGGVVLTLSRLCIWHRRIGNMVEFLFAGIYCLNDTRLQ